MTVMATAKVSSRARGGRNDRKRLGKKLLVLSALAAVAFSAIAAVRQPTEVLKERLPIESVRIEGSLRHIARPELVAALADEIDGGFFGVDVARVQRAALALPWIKEAPCVLACGCPRRAAVHIYGPANQHRRRLVLAGGGRDDLR